MCPPIVLYCKRDLAGNTEGVTSFHLSYARGICCCKLYSRTVGLVEVCKQGLREFWTWRFSPSFSVERYHRKRCCDPSTVRVAMGNTSNPHPTMIFQIGSTHQINPPQLLNSICSLAGCYCQIHRKSERLQGSLEGGLERWMWEKIEVKRTCWRGECAEVQSGAVGFERGGCWGRQEWDSWSLSI